MTKNQPTWIIWHYSNRIEASRAPMSLARLATQIKDVKYKELLPCCSAHATPSSKSSCCVRGGWQVIFHSSAEEAKATAKIIKKSLGKAELIYSQSISNAGPCRHLEILIYIRVSATGRSP